MKRVIGLLVLGAVVGCGGGGLEKQDMMCTQFVGVKRPSPCQVEMSSGLTGAKLEIDAGNYTCKVSGKLTTSSEDSAFVASSGSCVFLDTPFKTCKATVLEKGRVVMTPSRSTHDGKRTFDIRTDILAVKLEDSERCAGETREIGIVKTGAYGR